MTIRMVRDSIPPAVCSDPVLSRRPLLSLADGAGAVLEGGEPGGADAAHRLPPAGGALPPRQPGLQQGEEFSDTRQAQWKDLELLNQRAAVMKLQPVFVQWVGELQTWPAAHQLGGMTKQRELTCSVIPQKTAQNFWQGGSPMTMSSHPRVSGSKDSIQNSCI